MTTDSYLGSMSGCTLWATSFKLPVTFSRKWGTLVTFCNTPHIERQNLLNCKDKKIHISFMFCYSPTLATVLLYLSSTVSGHWCFGLIMLRPQICLPLWFQLLLCLIVLFGILGFTYPSIINFMNKYKSHLLPQTLKNQWMKLMKLEENKICIFTNHSTAAWT